VNPSDAFLLDQGETQLRTHCDSSTVLNFKIDENLTVGSARIETRSAKILLDPKAHLCRYSESLKRVSRIAQ